MMENQLAEALKRGEFVVTCELIPGRGANEAMQAHELEEGKKMWATGRVHALSITDNPGGNPALLPEALAQDLVAEGITPLVHLSCKDRNRNQFESQLYAMERHGIQNVLCMSGDYPVTGWNGRPRPVFDLDPVQLLEMVGNMNRGMGYPNRKGEIDKTKPTNFLPGAVVSPFKWTEGETLTQYFKLEKKVFAGAKFIINQVGYDARKIQELLWWMKDHNLDVPVIANIYVLSYGVGKTMNSGGIPGCDVTDEFVEVLRQEAQAEDKGKEARLVRAAKMIAISKGLGYAGVHIGGMNLTADMVSHILELADGFEADWEKYAPELNFAQKNCFYYYKGDSSTGLNIHEESPRVDLRSDKAIRGNYRLSRTFHHLVFIPNKGVNPIFTSFIKWREKKKGVLRHHAVEHMSKVALYECMDCGDCGLYATAYTCPMVNCPKCQRNGPCGGSKDGWCEVYPGERYCIWFKAYYRLKNYGDEGMLDDYVVPPNNWTNFAKSPWSNNVHGRDGYCRREWLPGVEPDVEFKEGPKPADDAPRPM
ncbi:MAG: methylenetetrahydrofolate reductase [Actinobacteria bacterium]|nr:methylenetetrahydrofolate reductase [Actinomycetota bacterium]